MSKATLPPRHGGYRAAKPSASASSASKGRIVAVPPKGKGGGSQPKGK